MRVFRSIRVARRRVEIVAEVDRQSKVEKRTTGEREGEGKGQREVEEEKVGKWVDGDKHKGAAASERAREGNIKEISREVVAGTFAGRNIR